MAVTSKFPRFFFASSKSHFQKRINKANSYLPWIIFQNCWKNNKNSKRLVIFLLQKMFHQKSNKNYAFFKMLVNKSARYPHMTNGLIFIHTVRPPWTELRLEKFIKCCYLFPRVKETGGRWTALSTFGQRGNSGHFLGIFLRKSLTFAGLRVLGSVAKEGKIIILRKKNLLNQPMWLVTFTFFTNKV